MEEVPLRPRATSTFLWSIGRPAAKLETKIIPLMATLVCMLITVTIAGVPWVDGHAIGMGMCGAAVVKQSGTAGARMLPRRVTARNEFTAKQISSHETSANIHYNSHNLCRVVFIDSCL